MALPSSRVRNTLAAAFLLLVAFVPGASAQVDANIGITADAPSGLVMPQGSPALVNITITYQCLGLDGEVTISASSNVSGITATANPATFTAQSASPAADPRCTPGSAATAQTAKIAVNATKDVLVGTTVPLVINVSGENILGQAQGGELEVEVQVGPYIDVTFAPNAETFEVPAGQTASVSIAVQSDSNVMVMGMPGFKALPTNWKKPVAFPTNVETPLVDGNGSSAVEFDVEVPKNTPPGEYVVEFEIFAHTMGDVGPTLNTETKVFPLTFTVTPGAAEDEDTEEGPGFGPVPLVLLAVALLGMLRRRL